MSNHTEEAVHVGGTIMTFNTVWIALLALTGIEILLAYEQLPVHIMLTALVGISVIKAVLIIAYFMHLKFEKLSLFLTLFPMLIFCVCLLFVWLPDAERAMSMRPPSL
jgi:cytochrome c oxidase subunit IV